MHFRFIRTIQRDIHLYPLEKFQQMELEVSSNKTALQHAKKQFKDEKTKVLKLNAENQALQDEIDTLKKRKRDYSVFIGRMLKKTMKSDCDVLPEKVDADARSVEAFVNEAQSINGLIKIMEYTISLQSLKDDIIESLKLKNENEMKSIHFNVMSIENILPYDVIQSALNYISHQESIKSVSKSFKKMAEQNLKVNQQSRQDWITAQFNGGSVWKIQRKAGGFQLQQNGNDHENVPDLMQVFNKVKAGDKIFFYPGRYEFSDGQSIGMKDMQIHGIGECFFSPQNVSNGDVCFKIQGKLSIRNVRFDQVLFDVRENNSLYMVNCQMSDSSLITLARGGHFDCYGCQFDGDYDGDTIIWADGARSLCIEQCLFEGWEGRDAGPCIWTQCNDDIDLELKMIENAFIGKRKPPIGGDDSFWATLPNHAFFLNNRVNNIRSRGAFDILYAFLSRD